MDTKVKSIVAVMHSICIKIINKIQLKKAMKIALLNIQKDSNIKLVIDTR